LESKKTPEAREAFNKAIMLNQNKAIYLASLGVVNCLTKMYQEAFDNFLKATHLDQNIHEVWFDIGILYETHQQLNEALVAYQRAIDVTPDYQDAINRKQGVGTEVSATRPLPAFVHPEFRVSDTMIPIRSFLNNQKVKKACEPCYGSQITSPQNLNPIVRFCLLKILLDQHF
jgi:tetratricopeptide (TPR) repeat protein